MIKTYSARYARDKVQFFFVFFCLCALRKCAIEYFIPCNRMEKLIKETRQYVLKPNVYNVSLVYNDGFTMTLLFMFDPLFDAKLSLLWNLCRPRKKLLAANEDSRTVLKLAVVDPII